MNREKREEIVESLLSTLAAALVDNELAGLTAESNNFGWGYSGDVENLHTWHEDSEENIGFFVDVVLTSDFSKSLSPLDTIFAKVEGVISYENGEWRISEKTLLDAEFDYSSLESIDSELEKAILSNANYFKTFSDELSKLKQLNNFAISDSDIRRTLQGQIYIGAITCMETYLSDAFINTVLSNEEFLISFFTNYDFAEKKIEKKELYKPENQFENLARREMLKIIYHNLKMACAIYRDVLNVAFPDFGLVNGYVSTRHDLVHRNGKTKEGNEVAIDKEEVDKVIDDVETFITNVDTNLKAMIAKKDAEVPF